MSYFNLNDHQLIPDYKISDSNLVIKKTKIFDIINSLVIYKPHLDFKNAVDSYITVKLPKIRIKDEYSGQISCRWVPFIEGVILNEGYCEIGVQEYVNEKILYLHYMTQVDKYMNLLYDRDWNIFHYKYTLYIPQIWSYCILHDNSLNMLSCTGLHTYKFNLDFKDLILVRQLTPNGYINIKYDQKYFENHKDISIPILYIKYKI